MDKLRCYNYYHEWMAIPEETIRCPHCWSMDWNNPEAMGSIRINGIRYHGLEEVKVALRELGVRLKGDAPRYTIRTKKTTSVGMSQ